MIAILILSLLHLSTAGLIRQPDARVMGIEETLDELLYDLPEYDDPQMLEYEISQLDSHPIMSLIHMAKKRVNSKHKHVMSTDAVDNLKLGLDSIITRLQTIQARLENDSSHVPVEDIEKAVQDFKKLEHIIRPDIDQLKIAMHQGLSRSESMPQGGLLRVRSRRPPVIEVSTSESVVYEIKHFTTEVPVHEKKPSVPKPPVHEVELIATKPPVHEIELPATKAPVHEVKLPVTKPPVHEAPKPPVHAITTPATEELVLALLYPSTEAPKDAILEEEIRAPYKDDFFKSESTQERYEMNPYQSRWIWKTADFAK